MAASSGALLHVKVLRSGLVFGRIEEITLSFQVFGSSRGRRMAVTRRLRLLGYRATKEYSNWKEDEANFKRE